MKIVKVVYISREREITLSGPFAEAFILHFGSLVREEAAKTATANDYLLLVDNKSKWSLKTPGGHEAVAGTAKIARDQVAKRIQDISLPALLEKMGEGV